MLQKSASVIIVGVEAVENTGLDTWHGMTKPPIITALSLDACRMSMGPEVELNGKRMNLI